MNAHVKIVGIDASDCGHFCKRHQLCCEIVKEDTVLHFVLVSVVIDGVEEPAIEGVEVEGGCCKGFSRRHLIKYADSYEDGTSQTKQQLHYQNKSCAFAVIKSFRPSN